MTRIASLARRLAGLALVAAAGVALAQAARSGFDHLATGFALTGAHTEARCEACHLGGQFKGTPRDCASCHTSGSRWARGNVVKGAQHVPTNQPCDACHNTRTYSGARFDHAGARAGACAACHNGAFASAKPGGHFATSASCDTCHRTSAWRPATGFDHSTAQPGQCASCHNGVTAPGRNAQHIPVGGQSCDGCHTPAGWRPARWSHALVAPGTGCAACHDGAHPPANGKPANALHAGIGACEACHKSTAGWSAAKIDHAGFGAATNCANCHNGSAAPGRNANHIPTGAAACQGCHTTSGWKPARFNHTQVPVVGQCASCHNGAYPPADGRNATHVPYQTLAGVGVLNCDACHKAGYASWTPARVHGSISVATQCASCHSGSFPPAVGKPATATHVGVTACEGCHRSTSDWRNVTFAHSAATAVGSGTCDTCHNGTTATGKQPGHIPVTRGVARCDACHRSQTRWSASVTMNHTAVAASSCKSCHNGSYVSQGATGALAKPTSHIPEATQLLNGAAMDCNACHRSTTLWGAVAMNHNGSLGGGAGWCKGCHLAGTPYAGDMRKHTMTHVRKTPPAIDCSESGCHRPLGGKGKTYLEWD